MQHQSQKKLVLSLEFGPINVLPLHLFVVVPDLQKD